MVASGAPLHHGVARELGIEVIDGVWAVGETVTLEEIQDRFTVSRTVAREVARQLEAMGLAKPRRRLGLIAQPISEWSVLDPRMIDWRLHSTQRERQIYTLTQLRLAVEPAAAENAARVASIQSRAQLLPIAAELRRTGEAGDLLEFMKYDIEFHSTLLRSSGNEMFAALSSLVAAVLQGRTELGLMPENPKPEALDGHEAVARAIFDGDPVAARAAMQGIIDEVREVFEGLDDSIVGAVDGVH